MVDDEDDLTPLPQGIHPHAPSSGAVLKMNPRPPLTRISSSDKLQNLRPHSLDKGGMRGRHPSEERSSVSKSPATPTKSSSQGPEGSHIMFR